MISDAQFLEQDEQILNIFKEEGASLNSAQEDSDKERVPRDLTIEDLNMDDEIVNGSILINKGQINNEVVKNFMDKG